MLKPPRSRRLWRENWKLGFQGERTHTRAVVSARLTRYWTMIAQAPAPVAASVTPAAAPTSAPAIGSTSTRRKSMSRSISDSCGAPSAPTTKLIERTARSG